jgi:hypothetical protein
MTGLIDAPARCASRPAWSRPAGGLALALLVLGGCGDDDAPVGPASATFEVVVSGGAPAGAMLFLIEGGPVDSIGTTGWFTASAPYSGVATQVVVAGPTLAGAVAVVHVPDGRIAYRAVVREVAEAGTHALLPTGDYTLTLERRRP